MSGVCRRDIGSTSELYGFECKERTVPTPTTNAAGSLDIRRLKKGRNLLRDGAMSTTRLSLAACGGHQCWLHGAWVACTGLSLAVVSTSLAEGFRNPANGPLGLARAGGGVAWIDDATAITVNPANLVELKQPSFSVAPNFVYVKVDYTSGNGQSAVSKNPWKILPNLYATIPIKEDAWVLGLGLSTPFAMDNVWDTTGSAFKPLNPGVSSPGPWAYNATHDASLKVINFNPSVGFRLTDTLSAGVGLDVFWSEVKLSRFYPWAAITGPIGNPPVYPPDGVVKVKGDGTGAGGNVGLTWEPAKGHRLAFSYRSQVDVDYDGHSDVSNFVSGAIDGTSARGPFNSRIKFPTTIGLGYGVQLCETMRLELDVEWIQFSRFKSFNLDMQGNSALLTTLGNSTTVAEGWRDTCAIGIGGDWQFRPGWYLRGGYQFCQTPVPTSTMSATFPDSNQHALTVGVGYRKGRHAADLAIGEVFHQDRKVSNNQNAVFDGHYKFQMRLMSLAYQFQF